LPVTFSLLIVTYITYRQSDCFAVFPVSNFDDIFPDRVNNEIFIWCLGLGLGLDTSVLVTSLQICSCFLSLATDHVIGRIGKELLLMKSKQNLDLS